MIATPPFFSAWLFSGSTLVTVIGPAAAFAAGLLLVPTLRRGAAQLTALALMCVPLSFAASYWDAKGLHVVPLHMAPYLALMAAGQLRGTWFGVAFGIWAGTIAADGLGTWAAWHAGSAVYAVPTWFWGIGGYGVADALVLYPLLFTPLLFVGQVACRRWPARRPKDAAARAASLSLEI